MNRWMNKWMDEWEQSVSQSVEVLSRVRLFATPWIAAWAMMRPGLPVHHQLPEFTQTHAHRVSDAIQPSHPLLSPSPPAPNPSQHQGLSSESTLHIRWLKYWSFSFSISPSNEYPGLISLGMDWSDLLAVQGSLKSLLQHHSAKASIFQCSAFFTVQLSHPYMTTGKTIALTSQTFVGKVMSLLFNLLSRLVITFLPRSKRLLISSAAAAKLLQLCLTLCDPINGSPPGSPVPGILQARTLEWVAISFSNAGKWKVKVKSLSRVLLFATPWTPAYQAPPSMGFSRQEHWSGVPEPSPNFM